MGKETKSLADCGFFERVYIGAIWQKGLPEREQLDQQRSVWRVRLATAKLGRSIPARLVQSLEWMWRLLWGFRKEKITVISCHCLSVLPLGLAFKLFYGSKIVYEAHELETDRNTWSSLQKAIARPMERFLIKFVDASVVVGDSIAEWYRQAYNLKNVFVVKNVPYRDAGSSKSNAPRLPNVLREKFSIPETDVVFLYQGVLGTGRAIEVLLDVFSQLDKSKHIIFMGYGALEGMVDRAAAKSTNIHRHPAVDSSKLLDYTICADVGVALFEDTCLSYRYSCPNKMFEYVIAGVPQIIPDYPDMAAVIDKYDCGWKTRIELETLKQLFSNLDSDTIEKKRNNTLLARQFFGWHLEEPVLQQAYLMAAPALSTAQVKIQSNRTVANDQL